MTVLPADEAARLLAAIAPHLPDTASSSGALDAEGLVAVPDYGAGHRHVVLGETGLLARIPRRVPEGSDPAAHLAYEAACFARAQASGATPRCHGVVPPGPDLPMGALLVQRIEGAVPRLPGDLPAIARALAALHGLALPRPDDRPPLPEKTDPVAGTVALIARQAGALEAAGIDPASVALIREECAAAARLPEAFAGRAPPIVLAGVDTHPGNFLIDGAGHAWFVDLERVAYDAGAIDICHVTLPTSTGWDMRVATTVDADAVGVFEAAYLAALPADLAAATRPWLGRLRRLTWLRSLTWFAQWRSRWRSRQRSSGNATAAQAPDEKIVAHMAAHVDAMLSASHIERMRDALPTFA